MIEVDGSYGEGGGQILRSSLTLSAITGKPVTICRIRANRTRPGLRAQHLACVKAIAKITAAELHGASLDSTEITLIPSSLRPGDYCFDIPTAGSLSLLFQTVFLPLSFAAGRSRVTFTGGTHVPWSPNFHYLHEHWLPLMERLGFRATTRFIEAGFYPQGGGKVQAQFLPAQNLQPYTCIKRGELINIRGISGYANLDDAIAKRQKHQALKRLYEICKDTKIKTLQMESAGKGTFVLLNASFSNCGSACFTALGAPGKPAEKVADEAVDQMLAFLKTEGCVDHYLADQLLLPLSLVDGISKFRTNVTTQHLKTNAYVVQKFIPAQITLEDSQEKSGLVTIKGASVLNLINGRSRS